MVPWTEIIAEVVIVEAITEGRGAFKEEAGLELGFPWNSFLLPSRQENWHLWSKAL